MAISQAGPQLENCRATEQHDQEDVLKEKGNSI